MLGLKYSFYSMKRQKCIHAEFLHAQGDAHMAVNVVSGGEDWQGLYPGPISHLTLCIVAEHAKR